MKINYISSIIFQGKITDQGLLVKKDKLKVYKRKHGLAAIGRQRAKHCMVFLFDKSIVICVVEGKQLEYWTSFKVSSCSFFIKA